MCIQASGCITLAGLPRWDRPCGAVPARSQAEAVLIDWRPLGARPLARLVRSQNCVAFRLLARRCGRLLMTARATAGGTGIGCPDLLIAASFEGLGDADVAHCEGQGVHDGVLGHPEEPAPSPADPPTDGSASDANVRSAAVRRL